MSDYHTLAEALRPQVAELAREIAPAVRAQAAQTTHPATFEAMTTIYLEGVLHQELGKALQEGRA